MPITEIAKHQAPLEAMQGYFRSVGNLLRSTAELVAIPSVTQALDASSATPFGVESDRAVDKLLADMGALGYRTEKDATGYFGYGEFGNPDAKNWVLIAGHVDVVDPLKRADWFGGDPFATNLRVVDGGVYLVGRGWSDDKGPTAAATYGLAQLIGQPLRDDVRVGVAIFPDEEKGIWAGAKKFVELKGLPSVALAPDHEYAITQEMAKLGFSVVGEGTPEPDKENLITVSSINTGSNPGNTVPGEVEVVFKAKNKSFLEFFLSSITRHARELNGSVEKIGEIEKPNGSYVLKVVVKGKAVHAAKAYEGVNAVQVLAQLLEKAPMKDNVPSRLVYFILEGIGLGARGEAFGFQGGDPAKVGSHTLNVGIVKVTEQRIEEVAIDSRVRLDVDPTAYTVKMEELAGRFGFHTTVNEYIPPLAVDTQHPVIDLLRDTFTRHTGGTLKEDVGGGRTFGTAFVGQDVISLAFGCRFLTEADTMHQVAERQSLLGLVQSGMMYLDLVAAMAVYHPTDAGLKTVYDPNDALRITLGEQVDLRTLSGQIALMENPGVVAALKDSIAGVQPALETDTPEAIEATKRLERAYRRAEVK